MKKIKVFCSKCKINKRQEAKAGHLLPWCKKCYSVSGKDYYSRHKESSNRRSKIWMLKNPEKYKEILRKSANKRRMACLEYYSNGKLECVCCGDGHIEFLTIDHINGGGRKHRMEIGDSGQSIFSWLKKNKFPVGYRVLCHNCNSSLGHYKYCPHELYEHKK